MTESALLTRKALGLYLGVSASMVDNLRKRDDFPKPLGFTLAWSREEIDEWVRTAPRGETQFPSARPAVKRRMSG